MSDSDEIRRLQHALDESVKLQSHYAKLLNAYDGGKRMQFADSDAWLARLAEFSEMSHTMTIDAPPPPDPRGPYFLTAWEREDYERQKRGEEPLGPFWAPGSWPPR